MEVKHEKLDKWMVITVEGRLDTVSAPDFDKYLTTIEEDYSDAALVLSSLDYMSSTGLRCLLKLSKMLAKKSGQLVLVSPSGMVKEVLEESGMDSLLEIFDSLDDLPKA